MEQRVVFMFSGQGSHYYHMGEQMFNHDNTFREVMIELDGIVKKLIGESIIKKIYQNNMRMMDSFDRLIYTHPAIFMIEYSLTQMLIEKGIKPECVLGVSLGEYSSATIAGILNVDEALESIIVQANAIEKTCPAGKMLAVLGPYSIFEDPMVNQNSELASINYDSHFVISGESRKLDKIEQYLQNKGIYIHRLPVLFGFHSSAIDPISQQYRNYLDNKSIQLPQIDFISGLYGEKMEQINTDYLWDVIRKPMKFSEAIRLLEDKAHHLYLDVGPSGTLSNFAKHHINSHSHSNTYSIMTPFKRELHNLDFLENKIKQERMGKR
ncbi:acyltransferase domain-containing protein [Gracilibacillus sp. S3-1-1]|uniref:Acyltransferase domain-containing protein n=1 Tax=Gracilibacillus pellucidus TaxID=3095368 RepID=A0ACC6M8Q9_9BACI|nr:acyltransferase domain-containing protein [Gracilibacillus sp. S3-1-1]MDX8047237.1 acyltransferase domain-containing protein [Gracilibacillus sp. S3-1-1]